jgi:hypothetical protein
LFLALHYVAKVEVLRVVSTEMLQSLLHVRPKVVGPSFG